jgi:hypothetical protein
MSEKEDCQCTSDAPRGRQFSRAPEFPSSIAKGKDSLGSFAGSNGNAPRALMVEESMSDLLLIWVLPFRPNIQVVGAALDLLKALPRARYRDPHHHVRARNGCPKEESICGCSSSPHRG